MNKAGTFILGLVACIAALGAISFLVTDYLPESSPSSDLDYDDDPDFDKDNKE